MTAREFTHRMMAIMLLALMPLVSCARTVAYHEYEAVEKAIDGLGKIGVSVSGSYVENNKGFFGKRTTYGNPYFLGISFEPFSSGRICLSKITLAQNGHSKDIYSGKLICDEKDYGSISPKLYPIGYQIYSFRDIDIHLDTSAPVQFDIEYIIQGNNESNKISVILINKPVREEKRSDLLDMIGSG